ncbi:MAG TPA: hypothetical protein VGM23_02500 [Armatimonadota bacterium]
MKHILLAALAFALLAGSSIAFAYPNFAATNGIVAVPTAEIAATGTFMGAADALFVSPTTFNARAIYGVAANWEVGAGLAFNSDDTQLGLNAKIRIPGSMYGMGWALGASYVMANHDNNGAQIYFAGTRPITMAGTTGPSLLGTIGLSFTTIESLSALRPFLGGQLRFPTATEVGAEFVLESGDFSENITSFVIRQALGRGFTGEIGVTNAIGFAGTRDHNIFVGLTRALY